MKKLIPVLCLVIGGAGSFVALRMKNPPHDAAALPVAPSENQRRVSTAVSTAESWSVPAFDAVEAEIPPHENSWVAEMRALKELAAAAPDAALARVSEMSDRHERRIAAGQVCLAIAAHDPEKAMTAAWRLDLGKLADEPAENVALENLARRWAETNLREALRWTSALPADDESRRDCVVKGLVSAVAENSPAVAARLLAENMPAESHVQLDAAIEVVRRWAQRDYDGAVRWTALFPDGALRERAIDELASVAVGAPATGGIE